MRTFKLFQIQKKFKDDKNWKGEDVEKNVKKSFFFLTLVQLIFILLYIYLKRGTKGTILMVFQF